MSVLSDRYRRYQCLAFLEYSCSNSVGLGRSRRESFPKLTAWVGIETFRCLLSPAAVTAEKVAGVGPCARLQQAQSLAAKKREGGTAEPPVVLLGLTACKGAVRSPIGEKSRAAVVAGIVGSVADCGSTVFPLTTGVAVMRGMPPLPALVLMLLAVSLPVGRGVPRFTASNRFIMPSIPSTSISGLMVYGRSSRSSLGREGP